MIPRMNKLQLAQTIKKHIPIEIIRAEFTTDPDKRDYIVSNEKIESTGWAPNYSLDDGIKELIKTYSYLKINKYNNI